jgi:hypothetical protein
LNVLGGDPSTVASAIGGLEDFYAMVAGNEKALTF